MDITVQASYAEKFSKIRHENEILKAKKHYL
jgi:hypothetical protein